MSEAAEATVAKPRDRRRVLIVGLLILAAAIFSFLNADERIAVNLGFTTLYRLSLVGVVFSVFLLGMLTMFLFGLRHDRAVRDALRTQGYRQSLPIRPLSPIPSPVRSPDPGPEVSAGSAPSGESTAIPLDEPFPRTSASSHLETELSPDEPPVGAPSVGTSGPLSQRPASTALSSVDETASISDSSFTAPSVAAASEHVLARPTARTPEVTPRQVAPAPTPPVRASETSLQPEPPTASRPPEARDALSGPTSVPPPHGRDNPPEPEPPA